jgi:hypothetical protein
VAVIVGHLRRDPGLALALLALVLAAALYAPTLHRGLLDYDDTWLVRDNWIVHNVSQSSLHAIALDTSKETRAVLGAEYLPVRDVSVMLDFALWGRWWPGFHITNLALYLAAIALWFAAMVAFGLDRRLAGVAILIWALHPTHAESVSWLSERKGLLAIALSGACTLGYARFRSGAGARWLVLATLSAVATVWSKAPAAFALVALAALELALAERRVSWRRSLVGLGVIAAAGAAAFVPVVIVAMNMAVVGGDDKAPAGWLAMATGMFGFYLRLAALALPNAPSYPIHTQGPSALDLVLGVAGFVVVLGAAVVPRFGRWRPQPAVRAGSAMWLCGWFPVSRLAFPLRHVLVADRYLLFATLGAAIVVACGTLALPNRRGAVALIATLAVAAGLRTFDAQHVWRSNVALWERAIESNPADGEAWSRYSEQLDQAGEAGEAMVAVEEGLTHSRHPRLLLRAGLLAYGRGDRDGARSLLREAAEGDDPYAMIDLALVLADDHELDDAVAWARRAVATGAVHAELYAALAQVALRAGRVDEAIGAARTAYEIAPGDRDNRLVLARALIAAHRDAEARPHLVACLIDPRLARTALQLLGR